VSPPCLLTQFGLGEHTSKMSIMLSPVLVVDLQLMTPEHSGARS
jgi:hypothetical protein